MRDYNMSFAQPDLFFAYDTMELMKREFPNDQLLMFGALMMKFLTEAIDEDVRAKYEEAHPRKARSGRPSFDPAFMLRVLLLQRFLGLTNVAMASELRNNRKLAAVLGIRFISGLPTDKTIWQLSNSTIRKVLSEYQLKGGESLTLKSPTGGSIYLVFEGEGALQGQAQLLKRSSAFYQIPGEEGVLKAHTKLRLFKAACAL
ncbi:MAG: transposase [Succinivibrio sp.]|nr:transposase [Succinivibrio sp.]